MKGVGASGEGVLRRLSTLGRLPPVIRGAGVTCTRERPGQRPPLTPYLSAHADPARAGFQVTVKPDSSKLQLLASSHSNELPHVTVRPESGSSFAAPASAGSLGPGPRRSGGRGWPGTPLPEVTSPRAPPPGGAGGAVCRWFSRSPVKRNLVTGHPHFQRYLYFSK